jgi:hypothetical protein
MPFKGWVHYGVTSLDLNVFYTMCSDLQHVSKQCSYLSMLLSLKMWLKVAYLNRKLFKPVLLNFSDIYIWPQSSSLPFHSCFSVSSAGTGSAGRKGETHEPSFTTNSVIVSLSGILKTGNCNLTLKKMSLLWKYGVTRHCHAVFYKTKAYGY